MEKPEETAEDQNIEQAFEAAVAEHSSKEEQADGAKEALDDKGTGDTETGEEQQTQDTDEAQGASDESADEQLLTDEEFNKVRSDPEALRKTMNRAFTQKTQALAEKRKRLETYEAFIQAYEKDPLGTIAQVAEQNGYVFAPKSASKQGEGKPAETTGQTEQAEDTVSLLREALAADPEDLPARLASVVEKIADKRADEKIERRVKPVEEKQREGEARDSQREYQKALGRMDTRHKGWTKFKNQMVALDKKIKPQPGTTVDEYLDMLYDLATKDAKIGTKTRETVEKINRAAKESDDPGSGVPTSNISSLPENPSLEEAFELALQGKTIPADW